MTSSATVYLSATAQTQLNQLKAANATPLNRIDARSQAATKQQSSVTTLSSEATQLRDALEKLKSADAAGQADAIKTFVKEYNDLTTAFKSATGKGAVLSSASEVRFAQSNLRDPFQTIDVLSALKSAGVETTREGLKVAGAPSGTLDIASIAAAFENTLTQVDKRLSSVKTRLDNQLSNLSKERARVALTVERRNERTEQSYLKMYQVMQAMQGGSGGSTGAISLFG